MSKQPTHQQIPLHEPRFPATQRRDPTDVVYRWPAIYAKAPSRRDPQAYIDACRRFAYYDDGYWLLLTRDDAMRLRAEWQTFTERLATRGIHVAGPGTLLERWVNVVVMVLTLGLVSVRCPTCQGRKNRLDEMGWRRLLWAVYRR